MPTRSKRVFNMNSSNLQGIKISKLRRSWWGKRHCMNKLTAWKILNVVIFIICSVFFFYQSANFLNDYHTYPTSTRFKVLYPKKFKMPAITLCNYNPIRRSKYCSEYPYSTFCERPKNLTEFCSKFPHMCSGNISNLLIPNYDLDSDVGLAAYYSVIDLYRRKRNLSMEAWSHWTWDIPESESSGHVRDITAALTLSDNSEGPTTCYSVNLQLYTQLPQRTWNIHETETDAYHYFQLNVDEDESFNPYIRSQVNMMVHSPFEPIWVLGNGEALKIGHSYMFDIKLEEEHLLEHPYQTDCIDYHALWRKNNKTGPRSQEACKQLCLWFNSTKCHEFPGKMILIHYSQQMCGANSKNLLSPSKCRKNCKASCEKLKYSYSVIVHPMGAQFTDDERRNKIVVMFIVSDPQVVVMSHIPTYDSGDLFSYIGGLMGCWLGISVATFPATFENIFTEVMHIKSRLKIYFK